jgi:predicted ester cyclase
MADETRGTAPDHKATILRMFDEIINGGKLEVVDELFHPDFRTRTPQGELDREGFKEYVAGWRAGFPDVHCEVNGLIAEGDRVAWSVRATGTHAGDFMGIPATGRSIDFDSLNLGTFKDGLALRHWVLMDTMTVLTQLGVMAPPGP